MKDDKKKQRNLLIIGLIAVLIILVSSSYAFFSYLKKSTALILRSNSVTASFSQGTNEISYTDAYPISDEYALSNLSSLDYVDFTVSGNSTNQNGTIQYEIYLTEKNGNTLDSNYVKVYLTDDNDNVIVEPTIYSSLENTSYANDSSNGKLIYVNSETGQFSENYRLYVWLSSAYSDNTLSRSFNFYVNLYAHNAS